MTVKMHHILRAFGGRGTRTRSGFTLIELLVVIAICCILMGLLMPALGKSQARARYVSCASNFKQISVGYQLYRDTHRGVPPSGAVMGWMGASISIRHVKGYDDGRGGGPEKYGMPSALYRYVNSDKPIWVCPSYKQVVNVCYYANLTQLGYLARGNDRAESINAPGTYIRVCAANIDLFREVGSRVVFSENNYREWGYKTGVYKSSLSDAGPCLDPRVFGHHGGNSYKGAESDLVLTADGTVAVLGAWGKWKTREFGGPLI